MPYNISMKASLSLLVLVCVSGGANASFDLMLLPDTTTGGIVRYDPVNRVRLGTFAQSVESGWHSVNLSSTSSQVYLTGSHTSQYNYSTGLPVNSTTFPAGITSSNIGGTAFTESFGATAYRYNSSMGSTGNFGVNVITQLSSVPMGNNRVGILGLNAVGDLVIDVHNITNSTFVTSLIRSAASYNADSASALTVISDNGDGASLFLTFRSAGVHILSQLTVNLSTSLTSNLNYFSNISGFAVGAKQCIVRSHDGVYIVGRDATTPTLTRITAVNNARFITSNYTTSDVSVPTSRWVGANVVAPEPGSMAVLGLGLLGLVKRRKK